MYKRLKEPFGKAGLIVALFALVFALVGGAYAANGGDNPLASIPRPSTRRSVQEGPRASRASAARTARTAEGATGLRARRVCPAQQAPRATPAIPVSAPRVTPAIPANRSLRT